MIKHSRRQKTLHLLVDNHRAALLALLASRHGVRPMVYVRNLLHRAMAEEDPESYKKAEALDLASQSRITKGPKVDEIPVL